MDKEILEYIERVHEFFKKNGLTLSVAESCTGGLISHYITMLPGASTFFESGVISYSAGAKQKILGISSETISKFGIVSEETAKEMSEKMRALTKTDFSLSTTGNLGPDVLEGKEKGLIYIAVSKKEGVFSKQIRETGTREENKERATLRALKFLVETMET
jgi:PncC family amidohydrolase